MRGYVDVIVAKIDPVNEEESLDYVDGSRCRLFPDMMSIDTTRVHLELF